MLVSKCTITHTFLDFNFPFILFHFLFLMQFVSHICSYKVATIVCLCTPCNKLLIFFLKKRHMIPNHLNQIIFSRLNTDDHNYLRAIIYINICLTTMCFSLRKDIFNYKDICYFSFFNNSLIFFMINDDDYSALKYLKNTEANICNVLIMVGNFNIRDSNWDLSYSFHSSYSNILVEIVDFFDLTLSSAIQQVST